MLVRFGVFDAEIRSAHEQQRFIELAGIIDMFKRTSHLAGEWEETAVENEEEPIGANSDSEESDVDNSLDEVQFPKRISKKELDKINKEETVDNILVSEEYVLASEENTLTNEEFDIRLGSQPDERMDVAVDMMLSAIMCESELDEETEGVVDATEGAAESVTDEQEDAVNSKSQELLSGITTIRWRLLLPGILILKGKRLPDPVDDAYVLLGGGIIYSAVEDYIATLRLLWKRETTDGCRLKLIIKKWMLETFFGSADYWTYTDLNPEKIMDHCWETADRQARDEMQRKNARILAGVESEEEQ